MEIFVVKKMIHFMNYVANQVSQKTLKYFMLRAPVQEEGQLGLSPFSA